jgi:hypothetical protein
MTPADLIQIKLRRRQIQNGSLRKGNLPGRIWHGLGGDSLGALAVEKNYVNRKRSVNRDATKCATQINASNTWVQVKGRVIMHVFTFSYEKISLGNDERQWVVDCVRQPRKNNGQFNLPCEGRKSEIRSLHGVPALKKRTLAP